VRGQRRSREILPIVQAPPVNRPEPCLICGDPKLAPPSVFGDEYAVCTRCLAKIEKRARAWRTK